MQEELTILVDAVLQSAKYRHVAPNLVSMIGEQELSKRRNVKAAVKATKNKLHQTVGAYWHGDQAYSSWLAALAGAAANPALLRTVCRTLMSHHASTRERLPLLDEFYPTIFSHLPPMRTVLDLACGLNPLAIPWMPLANDATYYACDIAQDQITFLQEVLPLLEVQGEAILYNLLQDSPLPSADVALLLKTLPCLEQVNPVIGQQLLERIDAPVLIVSFPGQSLGGRHKGMTTTYPVHFQRMVQGTSWQVEEFSFATEIVFRLRK